MKKINLFILLMISCTVGLFAQSNGEMQYSQSVSNLGWLNPSYHGLSRDVTGSVLYGSRNDGHIKSTGFDVHGGLPYQHFGFGISGVFFNSNNRKRSVLGIDGNADIKLSCNSYLLFGLFAGIDLERYDEEGARTGLDWYNPEPSLGMANYNSNNFTTTFGLTYVYKRFRIGSSFRWNVPNSMDEIKRDPFITYGHVEYEFLIKEKFSIRPMLLCTYSNNLGGNVDIGSFFGYRSKNFDANLGGFFRAGRTDTYLSPKSFTVMADVSLSKAITLAYSYDFNTGGVSTIRTAHELGLRFNINKALGKESFDNRRSIRDFSW